jgi:hypothetical protein
MKLRKRERALAGVFAVSLAGLAVDRFCFPESAPRAAAAAESEPGAVPASTAIPLAPATTTRPAVAEHVTDVFAWSRLGEAGMLLRTAAAAAPPETETTADAFQAAHRLDAVILGQRPLALVDGVALRIGDTLDGFTLRAVGIDSAEFSSDLGIATLRLPAPGAPR